MKGANLATGPEGTIDAEDTRIRGGNGAVDLGVAGLLAYGRADRGDAGPLICGTLLTIVGGRGRSRGNGHRGSTGSQHRCDELQPDSHGVAPFDSISDVCGGGAESRVSTVLTRPVSAGAAAQGATVGAARLLPERRPLR